jgi:hypothetical protein
MDFNKQEYKRSEYEWSGKKISIYFHSPKYSFHEFFDHKRRTKKFQFYRNLLEFLFENDSINIYFTLDELANPFIIQGNDLIVNMEKYQCFCRDIKSKTSGRAKAFFGKHISLSALFTSEEKENYVSDNLTSDLIVKSVSKMDSEQQKLLFEQISKVTPVNSSETHSYNIGDLVLALKNFSSDPILRNATTIALPYIQLGTLQENLNFLIEALDKNKSEKDIQNWIDEDGRRFCKQRCMIFGIDFIDPKREGELNRKRFDVLAEQNRRNHVLIELKGPNAEIFETNEVQNSNGGVSTEYHLSEELSRSIPQVLGYKKFYKEMSPEELEKIGLKEKKDISKCIIIIGKRKESVVWLENFEDLKNSLNGIEIWTYTDLVEKLQNTISNLENNL